MRISLHAAIIFAVFSGHAYAGRFVDLGVANGQMTSLSHNGRIAAGIAGESGWRWAKDRGASVLTGFVEAEGMSSWAQPIAGAWTNAATLDVAALAYSNSDLVGGPVEIGGMPDAAGLDGTLSVGYGVPTRTSRSGSPTTTPAMRSRSAGTRMRASRAWPSIAPATPRARTASAPTAA